MSCWFLQSVSIQKHLHIGGLLWHTVQGCLAEGLQRTSAGLGSVIIDSQPLTVTLLAALLFGERIRPAGALGLLAGVAGLCLLELPPDALRGLLQESSAGVPAVCNRMQAALLGCAC